jgi:hypothetical protein
LFHTGAAVAYFFTARRERLVRDCCIEADAAGIGIPAFSISVRYGTRAFRFQTGLPYSGTGLVPASAFLFMKSTVKSPLISAANKEE